MIETALAWSGGKDSALALSALMGDPAVRVAALVTTLGETERRVSMHGIRENLLDRQAAALGLPLAKAWLPAEADNERYRERFAAALTPLIGAGVTSVAFGDIALADVRAFREAQMTELGLESRFPLWGRPTVALAEDFIATGHHALLCMVDAEQLDPAFLGREFDAALLADLPTGVDPCGENGEFHTLVYDGPHFREPVAFARGRRHVADNRFHFLDLEARPV